MSWRKVRWRSEYAPQAGQADLTMLLILALELEAGPRPIHSSLRYFVKAFDHMSVVEAWVCSASPCWPDVLNNHLWQSVWRMTNLLLSMFREQILIAPLTRHQVDLLALGQEQVPPSIFAYECWFSIHRGLKICLTQSLVVDLVCEHIR